MPQILPSLFHDYPAEENQGNQIRYCHQCIENVCQIPDEVETDYGTEIYGNQKNYPVDIDDRLDSETLFQPCLSGHIFHSPFTVIAPAEYCAESKSQRAEGQQGSVFIMRDAAPNFVNSQNMHNFELIFQNVFLAMEYLSKQRYDVIQTELNGLINEVYPKVRENLAETASQGDRSDNAGYREAKRWNLLISTQMSR